MINAVRLQRRRNAFDQIRQLRLQAGGQSFAAFCRCYLPAHFQCDPSRMHEELFVLLQEMQQRRSQRIAIAAPRGHAKSTIVSQAYVLWCICYAREPFILLISNTVDQASDCLSMIKGELQNNLRLQEDFPAVCEPPGNNSAGAIRWRREEIITRNGVKVTALGADKQIRGRKHHQHRPTLIILDDVENEVEVRSADQRQHKWDWFSRAMLKAGSGDTNVIVIGTILHYDSLLARLIDPAKSPGWVGRKYQAVERWSANLNLWEQWQAVYCGDKSFEDRSGPVAGRAFFDHHQIKMLDQAVALWPQREDYYRLMEIRLTEGRASFDSEKQNEPVDPQDCYFQEDEFRYWEDEFESLEQLITAAGREPRFFGACDPSLGKLGRGGIGRTGGRGDDSAIVTILEDIINHRLYVVDADIRNRKPDVIIESIMQYQRLRRYRWFGMETNQFQQFLADELRRRSAVAGDRVAVWDIHHSTDKFGRIQRLQALIASGVLRFSRRHTVLLDQLRQFPMGAHDDGPDALEMAVATATNFKYIKREPGRFSV